MDEGKMSTSPQSSGVKPSSEWIPETAPDDPRLGELWGRHIEDPEEAQLVLVGFPSDEGVRRNGGRPGAASGPAAIREALYTLTPDARCFDAFAELVGYAADLGDVRVTGDVERDQARLGQMLAPFLKRDAKVVVLGGGHETAFAHFSGYIEADQPARILNWDAHPDVRPLIDGKPHSGSPFRQALDSGVCEGYQVVGLNPASVSRAHLRYIEEQGGTYRWTTEMTEEQVAAIYDDLAGPCMVTFDLDAVNQSWAPGVSAPNAGGLDRATWLRAAYEAGRCPAVTSIGISELNPRFDVDGCTARLAALTVWHVLRGWAERM